MVRSVRQRKEVKTEDVFLDSETSMDQHDFEMSCPFNDVFNSRDSPMDQIGTFLKNVQVLLEAASYIESAEKRDGSKSICVFNNVLPSWGFHRNKTFIVNRLRQQRTWVQRTRRNQRAISRPNVHCPNMRQIEIFATIHAMLFPFQTDSATPKWDLTHQH